MSCICKSCFTILRRVGRFFGSLCGCVKPEQDEDHLIVPDPGENGNDAGSSSSGSEDEAEAQRAGVLANSLEDLLGRPLGTPPILPEIPQVNRQQDPPAGPIAGPQADPQADLQADQQSDPPADPQANQPAAIRVITLEEWLAHYRAQSAGAPAGPAANPHEDDPPADLPALETVILTMSYCKFKSNLPRYHALYMGQVEEPLQVEVVKPLGRGSFGSVFECKSKEDQNVLFAVKGLISEFITPVADRVAWEQNVRREVAALNVLRHENIVEYHSHTFVLHEKYQVNIYAAIKTELLDCTLGEILKRRELTPEQVGLLIKTVGKALSWMVTQGYAHHDIKPDNIMFKNLDKNAQDFESVFAQAIPKITDFGFAHEYPNVTRDEAREETFKEGTPLYRSPEKTAFCKGEIKWYNPFKSDACSFGSTLTWCLVVKLAKADPFMESPLRYLNEYRESHPEVAESPYLTAIEHLIQPVPENRWHVSDVVASLE